MKESLCRKEDIGAMMWGQGAGTVMSAGGGITVEVVSPGRDSGDELYRYFTGAEILVDGARSRGKAVILSDSQAWIGLPYELKQGVVLVVSCSEADVVCDYDGEPLPVVCIVPPQRLINGVKELLKGAPYNECGDHICGMEGVYLTNLYDRLLLERLERKYNDILQIHDQTQNNWNETFHIMLFRAMGTNYNKEPFDRLSRRAPHVTICREKGSLQSVEALLLGAAGLLEHAYPDDYVRGLQKEYDFLSRKYSITAMRPGLWKMTGVNPLNSPVIRIAQIASLLASNDFIFDSVRKCRNIDDIRTIFSVTASEYWDTHIVPGRLTGNVEARKIGDTMVDLLAINLVAPVMFAYGNLNREPELKDRAIDILGSIRPEKNMYIKAWAERGVEADSAYASQALLQLTNEYCRRGRCCHCPVGHRRLKPLMEPHDVPDAFM